MHKNFQKYIIDENAEKEAKVQQQLLEMSIKIDELENGTEKRDLLYE